MLIFENAGFIRVRNTFHYARPMRRISNATVCAFPARLFGDLRHTKEPCRRRSAMASRRRRAARPSRSPVKQGGAHAIVAVAARHPLTGKKRPKIKVRLPMAAGGPPTTSPRPTGPALRRLSRPKRSACSTRPGRIRHAPLPLAFVRAGSISCVARVKLSG
jgi:hypothetical protein